MRSWNAIVDRDDETYVLSFVELARLLCALRRDTCNAIGLYLLVYGNCAIENDCGRNGVCDDLISVGMESL